MPQMKQLCKRILKKNDEKNMFLLQMLRFLAVKRMY